MTSSSRSSVGRPKEAINSLCQLMNLCGISGLNPEVFRQAKFNKPEAVAPLWSLLSSLTNYSKGKGVWPEPDASASHQATQSNIVSSTKLAMWSEGYRCRQFYHLPEDMSHGSRELLLACGWLLARTNIVTDLVTQDRANMVDTRHLHLEEVLRSRRQREEMKKMKDTIVDEERQTSHGGKHLVWLVGQCRMKLRRLHLQQRELCNLTHQIHVATEGVTTTTDSSHLSPLEVFILRHAEHSKKYQQILEAKQNRLHICLKWQEQQATFWQWMESVLDAKLQDSSEEAEMTVELHIPNPAHGSVGDPADLVRELEGHTQQLEQLVGDALRDYDFDKVENSKRLRVEGDIKAKLVPVCSSPTPCPSRLDAYQTARFHLIKKKPRTSGGQPCLSKTLDAVYIQNEILRLSELVEQLEKDLAELRSCHRLRMDELALMLPDAICIPPMGAAR
ncbi:tubulin epsilon and delta complex protein 1-like [Patiria miniata]|uniref:Tubulin epsilon and delta complex protein 1 domain-containing protein n=1 Tax=Patiria miniata TaxID=46514 RepID=A0A914BCY5_PATMI|nr:tubulin epsilon and delta complex protein 1-like [Patiria miniata]